MITPPVASAQAATTSAGNATVIGRLRFRLWDIASGVIKIDGETTRVRVAGEFGRLSMGPDRNRSPEVTMSRINIVDVVDGGTAVEGKTSVFGSATEDVATSRGVGLPGGGLESGGANTDPDFGALRTRPDRSAGATSTVYGIGVPLLG
jgi:hypothetical protein